MELKPEELMNDKDMENTEDLDLDADGRSYDIKPLERKELPEMAEDEASRLEDRINNLTHELQAREEELVEARENALRAMAEADNYKKRLEREHSERMKREEAELLVSFIPVLDTLDKALEHELGDWPEAQTFREGIELTRQQFRDILSRRGLERFNTIGELFDPQTSEALAMEDTSEKDDGVVIREFSPGYKMKGTLARPARVIVARHVSGEEEKSENEEFTG